MIGSSLTLLVAALISGLLGYTGLLGSASGVAQFLFWALLGLFCLALSVGGLRRPAY